MSERTFPMLQSPMAVRVILTACLIPALLIMTVCAGFVCHGLLTDGPLTVSAVLLTILAGVVLVFFWAAVCLELQRYWMKLRISEEGLTLLRPLLPKKHIPWDAFQQVNICYRMGVRGVKPAILCFVRHGEKKNLFGHWRTESILHRRSLISPYYTEALHAAAAACCPLEIIDLRNTPDYIQ